MNVLLPDSMSAALSAMADDPGLVPIAGGTDLLVRWPGALQRHAADYLDLSGLDVLRAIRWRPECVEIGATVTYWDTRCDERLGAALPMLQAAARQIGALQIQTRGTWGGNVASGSPVADGVVALMSHDAEVLLSSTGGERSVPLDAFYRGYRESVAMPGELIRALRVPLRECAVSFFHKVAPRQAQGISVLAVAATHSDVGWRVVAGGMAPTVRRCAAIEAILDAGEKVGRPEDLREPLRVDLTPIDDIRGTAEYRMQVLARVLFHRLWT